MRTPIYCVRIESKKLNVRAADQGSSPDKYKTPECFGAGRYKDMKTLTELIAKIARALNLSVQDAERIVLSALLNGSKQRKQPGGAGPQPVVANPSAS